MEKISNILPKNARIASADLKDAQALRPGAVGLAGQPMGERVRDRVTRSAIDRVKDLELQKTYQKNQKEAARVKIADDIAKRFFIENARSAIPGVDQTKALSVPEPEVDADFEGYAPEREEIQVSAPAIELKPSFEPSESRLEIDNEVSSEASPEFQPSEMAGADSDVDSLS